VRVRPGRSLRAKLVVTSVLVLAVMLAALAINSLRLMESTLIEQARMRARLLAPVLNAAIAPLLARRDYALLEKTLRESRTDDALSYLVVLDANGDPVAGDGWNLKRPLPRLEDNQSVADFKSDDRFDSRIPQAPLQPRALEIYVRNHGPTRRSLPRRPVRRERRAPAGYGFSDPAERGRELRGNGRNTLGEALVRRRNFSRSHLRADHTRSREAPPELC